MASCLNPTQWGRCRKCSACKDYRLRSWLLRMLLEAQLYDSDQVTFLTLTYSDDNLPGTPEAAKRQFQLWLKRLRKFFGDGTLRYVAALESGSRGSKRFHWHCILYGLRFNADNRHHIFRKWGNGFIDWKPASGGRMSYVLKYIIKGNKFLMSRRPGIGDGMIEHINKMIDGLSQVEKDKLIANQRAMHFVDLSLGIADDKKLFSITTLRQGGYYYPLHDFLKKRLRKFKASQPKGEYYGKA